jgi:hypothetical protein
MASISRRLKRLIQRERVVRGHLLGTPSAWDAPATTAEIDRALAYRVLVHAEVERYLEELVLAALASCEHLYTRLSSLRAPAFAAISLYQCSRFADGARDAWTDLRQAKVARALPQALTDARTWVERTVVANNHGVRSQNAVKLMGHLGISRSDLDPTLLTALDIFGGERGDAAHLSRREITRRFHHGSPSWAPKVNRLASPSDEVARVRAVLLLLPQLDLEVARRIRESV